MAERYKVSIRVASKRGTCANGHEVGDEWVVDRHTPEGVCLGAFNSLCPFLRVLMFGGSLPWEDDPDVTTIACPDSVNAVVFELRRLRE